MSMTRSPTKTAATAAAPLVAGAGPGAILAGPAVTRNDGCADRNSMFAGDWKRT